MEAQVLDQELPDLRGKYQALAILGSGGMAHVHLAVARGPGGFDKLVVLKTLRAEAAFDPELRKMFLGEARICARLSHPNVIHTYEVAIAEDGSPVLVMEYLEGAPLNLLMDRARKSAALPLRMRLSIVCDALEGLHYAHELCDFDGSHLAVVHRDISPHNLHVGLDGIVKVLDFGIARAKGLNLQTRAGVVKGKIRYMAPEQIRGEKIDRRADVYAMGAVLWELATDTRLWKGMGDVETMHKVVTQGPPRASSVRADLPAVIDAIVARAMSRDAAERHADCIELEADLERALTDMGGRAHAREVGKIVASLFEDVHAERKRVIEALLVQKSGVPSERPTVVPGRAAAPSCTLPPLGATGSRSIMHGSDATGSRSNSRIGFVSEHSLAAIPIAAPRWPRVAVLAALPVAIALVAAAHVLAPTHADPPPPAVASAAPLPTANEVTHPAEVRVVVNAAPMDATVLVDDAALHGAPAAGTYARDPSLHTVRVERAGYLPWTSRVSFDHELELWVTLEPAPPVPVPPATPSHAKAKSRAPVTTASKRHRPLDTSLPW